MFFWSNIKFYIKRKFSTYTALNELDKYCIGPIKDININLYIETNY